MALAQDLLPLIESLRAIPGELGFRPYTSVRLRTRTWSGAEPGDGTATDAFLALTTGGQPAKVREITSREVQSSGGRYTDADFVVGPLTPQHTPTGGGSAGYTPAELDPSSSARNVERHVVLVGPGDAASEWTIVDAKLDRPLRYTLVIRRTERTA
jgi:hypothetical protein